MQELLKQADDLAIGVFQEQVEIQKIDSQGAVLQSTLGFSSFGRKNVDAENELKVDIDVSADLGFFSFTKEEFERLEVETENIIIFRNEKYLVRKVYKNQTGNYMAIASEFQNSSKVGENAQNELYLFKIKASQNSEASQNYSDEELQSIVENYTPIAIYDSQTTKLKFDLEFKNLIASTNSELANLIEDVESVGRSFIANEKTYHLYIYTGQENEVGVSF